ncbi:MAG: hypothetical protein NT013_02705 [Planctomycetia bacterium]|nr:hypothetical protein [Planctomycetia bacterium]
MSVAILKLGGSLLDLPDLCVRLQAVFANFDGDRPLLICGGGEAADLVRRWHDCFELDEERSHWLALEAIRLNQRLLLDLLPKLELVSNRAAAESAWRRDRVPLLDLAEFVRTEEALVEPTERLPHCWDVTSDSLAAWVAARWPADRLILLKSVDLPDAQTDDSEQLASAGLIDSFFPQLTNSIPTIAWINLRREGNIIWRALIR